MNFNGFIGGFIPIITYGVFGEGSEEADDLITEDGLNILTESGMDILIET